LSGFRGGQSLNRLLQAAAAAALRGANNLTKLLLNHAKRRIGHSGPHFLQRIGHKLRRQFVAERVVRHLPVIPVFEELQVPQLSQMV
jgi:hypothetical protein